MRRIVTVWIFWSLFAFTAWSPPAFADATQHDQILAEILRYTGADQFYQVVHEVLDKGDEKGPEYIQAMKKSFDVELGKKVMFQTLSRSCDDDTLRKVVTWYRSPLGKRIFVQEVESQKEESARELLNFMSKLEKEPPPKERVELMARFINEEKMAETTFLLLRYALVAFATNYWANASPERIGEFVEGLDSREAEMVENLREHLLIGSLYTYRSISNLEMEQYIRFITSQEYQKFDGKVITSIKAGFDAIFAKARQKSVLAVREEVAGNL